MTKSILATALLAGALSGTASAAPQTCDFSAGPDAWGASSLTMTCGGPPLTVNARAGVYDGGSTSNTANFDESSWYLSVSRYTGSGLGVHNGWLDQHTVDNYFGDEYVRFVFSVPVQVLSVTLSRIGDDLHGADADVSFLSGALGGGWSSLTVSGLSELATYTHTLPTLAYSNEFRFGPRFGEHNDDFKIRSMVVQAQVPLPGTLALLGLGLAGFALARRRG